MKTSLGENQHFIIVPLQGNVWKLTDVKNVHLHGGSDFWKRHSKLREDRTYRGLCKNAGRRCMGVKEGISDA